MNASVVSVNVGTVRSVDWHDRVVTTAIWKSPVAGPVHVDVLGLDGDKQADPRVHGGRLKAVYAYSVEDYAWWSNELGIDLEPGRFGENLTTAGLDLNAVVEGDVWRVGTAVLAVTTPRSPCFKLGIRMGDAAFVQRFAAADRPGTYLRVIEPGEVATGAVITVNATA